MALSDVKALTFDVFGTVVNWRDSIAREAESFLGPKGYEKDWHAFADRWRARYQPAMDKVRRRLSHRVAEPPARRRLDQRRGPQSRSRFGRHRVRFAPAGYQRRLVGKHVGRVEGQDGPQAPPQYAHPQGRADGAEAPRAAL